MSRTTAWAEAPGTDSVATARNPRRAARRAALETLTRALTVRPSASATRAEPMRTVLRPSFAVSVTVPVPLPPRSEAAISATPAFDSFTRPPRTTALSAGGSGGGGGVTTSSRGGGVRVGVSDLPSRLTSPGPTTSSPVSGPYVSRRPLA